METTGSVAESQSTESVDSSSQETNESLQTGQGSTNEQTTSEQNKPAKRKVTQEQLDDEVELKINGKVERMTLKEALNLVSMGKASHQKFEEASRKEKELSQKIKLLELAEKNPREYYRQTGKMPDLEKLAEDILADKYKRQAMSEEQRRALDLEEENKKLKEEFESQKKQRDEQIFQQIEQQEIQRLDQEIGEAWKESGLPNDPYFATQIVYLMKASRNSQNPLTAKQAASIVSNKIQGDLSQMIEKMDAQSVLKLFGEKALKKVREFDIGRLSQAGNSRPDSQMTKETRSAKAVPPKVMGQLEYKEYMEKLKNQLTD